MSDTVTTALELVWEAERARTSTDPSRPFRVLVSPPYGHGTLDLVRAALPGYTITATRLPTAVFGAKCFWDVVPPSFAQYTERRAQELAASSRARHAMPCKPERTHTLPTILIMSSSSSSSSSSPFVTAAMYWAEQAKGAEEHKAARDGVVESIRQRILAVLPEAARANKSIQINVPTFSHEDELYITGVIEKELEGEFKVWSIPGMWELVPIAAAAPAPAPVR
jgi:hypothetical protein